MEQMTGIREQQEHLARLHFELGAQQELFGPLSDEGLRHGTENMHSLMSKLEKLSISIEKLHSFSNSVQDWGFESRLCFRFQRWKENSSAFEEVVTDTGYYCTLRGDGQTSQPKLSPARPNTKNGWFWDTNLCDEVLFHSNYGFLYIFSSAS